jgi:hypothetical protein
MVVAELLTRLGFEVDPRELNRGLNQARSSLQGFKSFLGKLALGVGFYEIGKHVVNMAAELETLNTQLHVMTGSTEKTQFLFKGIVDYAKNTAFYVKDVTGSVSTLLQGMVNVTDIMPKVKQLGDVAKDSTQLSSLAYAYAQVNRQGYMTNYESRMFQRSGQFGVYNQYAQMEAVQQGRMTKGQEITKGSALDQSLRARQGELFAMARHHEFTVQMLDKALDYATTKGGIFFEHQKEQVKTFAGAWSNMWDVLNINAALAMQKLFPIFKEVMKAITAIPFDWLVSGFNWVATAVQYLWDVLQSTDMVGGWVAIKQAVVDFVDAIGLAAGGTQGAGDSLKGFGETLGSLIGLTLRLAAVLLHLLGYLMYAIGLLREYKLLMAAFLILMVPFTGLGPAIARVTTFMVSFSVATAIASLRAFLLQGTLTSLWDYTKVFGTRSALNMFLSTSQAAMLGLTVATGWAIQKILELHEVIQDNAQVELQAKYSEWVANKSIAETEVKMAERDMYKYKHGATRNPLLAMEAQQKFLLHKKELDFLLTHPAAVPGAVAASPQDDLAARLLAQTAGDMSKLQDGLDKIAGNTAKIAGNTAPRSGVPNDVLRLADMSFRTHFDVAADGLMLAAE